MFVMNFVSNFVDYQLYFSLVLVV